VLVLSVLNAVVLLERVDLDPERHAFLPSVLSHGELCADAVNLNNKRAHISEYSFGQKRRDGIQTNVLGFGFG
jgi:hypothetical protein